MSGGTKGKGFEKQINKVCDYINAKGGFAHKLAPERNFEGIYLKGEPFDYILFLKDYKAAFDAKEIKGSTWRILDKDIKQANNLKRCKNVGLKAYFLICFEESDVREIDVDVVIDTLKANKKSIKKDNLPKWGLMEVIKNEV